MSATPTIELLQIPTTRVTAKDKEGHIRKAFTAKDGTVHWSSEFKVRLERYNPSRLADEAQTSFVVIPELKLVPYTPSRIADPHKSRIKDRWPGHGVTFEAKRCAHDIAPRSNSHPVLIKTSCG